MIRQAELSDLDRVAELGRAFHAYSPWRDVPYDAEAIRTFIAGLIEAGGVFLSESGMIGGLLSPAYFNPSFVIAVELFWWSPQGGGTALREAFEAWARENGAAATQFSALSDDQLPRVTDIYQRAGFQPAEVAFVKRF